jgi:hypothetical protein
MTEQQDKVVAWVETMLDQFEEVFPKDERNLIVIVPNAKDEKHHLISSGIDFPKIMSLFRQLTNNAPDELSIANDDRDKLTSPISQYDWARQIMDVFTGYFPGHGLTMVLHPADEGDAGSVENNHVFTVSNVPLEVKQKHLKDLAHKDPITRIEYTSDGEYLEIHESKKRRMDS